MAKGKQRPPQYIRQSQGYQRNMAKNEMKKRNIEMPKAPDMKKVGRINIAVLVVGVILSGLGFFFGGWAIGLIPVALVLIYFVSFYLYIRKLEEKYVLAYKSMGVTKDIYLKELKRRGTDRKEIDRISKRWDKVQEK